MNDFSSSLHFMSCIIRGHRFLDDADSFLNARAGFLSHSLDCRGLGSVREEFQSPC